MITYKSLEWLGIETVENTQYLDLLDEILLVQIKAFHKIFKLENSINITAFVSNTYNPSHSKTQKMFRKWISEVAFKEMKNLCELDLVLNDSLESYLKSMRVNTLIFMEDNISDLRSNVMSSLYNPTFYLTTISNRTKKPFP